MQNDKTRIILSAPAKSGYREEFKSVEEARRQAAILLRIAVDDMVEVTNPSEDTTYCYATQDDADNDDGAYAVQYSAEVA